MFAQRYDPNAVVVEHSANKLLRRKRKLEETRSKHESESESESESEKLNTDESVEESDGEGQSKTHESSDSDSESESDSEDESSESGDSESEKSEDDAMDIDSVPEPEAAEDANNEKPVEQSESTEDSVEGEGQAEYDSKHTGIMEKFKKSAKTAESESESEEEAVDTHDLAPMPQPELPRDRRLSSTFTHQQNLDWLASPEYILPEVTVPFENIGLSAKVLANLAAAGFTNAFSVQVGVLRIILEDIKRNRFAADFQGDILVNAATGSGKTLAYLIPIVEALQNRVVPRIRAIVLVPTKPLINQVTATLRQLASGTTLSIVSLTNELSVKEEGRKLLANVPDVVVATPGRLVEHLVNESISMESLRFLVIDEADRLLNQSFQNWCEIVLSSVEKWESPEKNVANSWRLKPQKMIFSATLTTDAGKLSLLKFQNPRLLVVNSQDKLVSEIFTLPATLSESKLLFSSSRSKYKPLLLAKFLLKTNKLSSVLVFAKSNDATLRLADLLNRLFSRLFPSKQINVAYINSTNNVASIRRRILRDFSNNTINILVATDLIARGLDLEYVTDVVNYDLPNSSREYVHRVGRTARANKRGEAYSMCFGRGEDKYFSGIMKDVGRSGVLAELGEESLDMTLSEEEKQSYKEVMEEFQDKMH